MTYASISSITHEILCTENSNKREGFISRTGLGILIWWCFQLCKFNMITRSLPGVSISAHFLPETINSNLPRHEVNCVGHLISTWRNFKIHFHIGESISHTQKPSYTTLHFYLPTSSWYSSLRKRETRTTRRRTNIPGDLWPKSFVMQINEIE